MRWTPWLLVCVLVTTASAQVRREPVRGSAVAADGQAWAGASVHLLSRPLPGDERLGVADEVAATTDDKGRFLAQLLPGRFYVAWAMQDLGENRYCASFPVEDVVAGRPLELVADAPRPRRRVVFTGLPAWREQGAIVATVFSATTPAIVLELAPDGDSLLLPPLPGRRAHLLVTAAGLPLFPWPGTIDLTQAEAEAEKVPAPRRVRLRIVDEQQQPVGGANLFLRTYDSIGAGRVLRHPVGTTDKKGDAVVTLPLREGAGKRVQWVNYAFGVEAPGLAPIHNIVTFDIAADHDAAKGDPAMTLKVPAGLQHKLRIVAGQSPLPARLVLRSRGASIGDPWGSNLPNQPATCDGDGCVEVLRMPDAVVVVLAEAAAVATSTAGVHPIALLGCIAKAAAGGDVTLDVARLQPLAMQVVDAAGTPVDAAHVALLVADGDATALALDGFGTDRTGRVAVLAPPDLPMTVVAWTASGCVVAAVPAAPRAAASPLVLKLSPAASVPGVVTGKDGKRVPFARVAAWISGTGGDTEALACAIRLVATGTARDGTFRLPMYPGLQYSLRSVATPDDEHWLDRRWTVGKDEPDELEIDLTKAR